MNIKAQAAKNVSGTIRKIDEYNRKTITAKTVKINATNAINQINTLLNRINALPTTKTVRVKVAQSGNISNIGKTRAIQKEPVLESPISEVSTVSSISEVSQINSTPMSMSRSSSPVGSNLTQSNGLSEVREELSEIGDTLKAINNSLRNDIVNNLDIEDGELSKLGFNIDNDVFGQLKNIMKEFTFEKISSMIPKFDLPMSNMSNMVNNNSNSVNFNSPLVLIEGNVDNGVMDNLESAIKNLKTDIINTIQNGDMRKKRLEGR